LQQGDIAVDIGANKGGYTYWMARTVQKTGAVFAFEPQKNLAKYLDDMLKAAGFDNTHVESLGISSSVGERTIVIPAPSQEYSPGASFEIEPQDKYYSYPVKVDTLDHYFLNKSNARPIKFIKCDVEGHELEIFRGGASILKEDRPVLLFECEQRHMQKNTTKDVFHFLAALGYEGEFIYDKKFYPLSEFDPARHQIVGQKPYANNFLFRADRS
jgi:FkbM family methyltransferase